MNFVKNFYFYLCLLSFGYIVGLIFGYSFSTEIVFYSVLFLSVFSFLIIFKVFKSKLNILLLLFIIPLIFGVFKISFYKASDLNVLNNFNEKDAVYLMKITSYPKETSFGKKQANAFVYKIKRNRKFFDTSFNINLYYTEISKEPLNIGDTIKTYYSYSNDPNNNLVYEKSKGQIATFYIKNYVKTKEKPLNLSFSYYFSALGSAIREKILFAIDKIYDYSEESAKIIKAILTGDKSGFSKNLFNSLSDAGFLHVAAVSGTHVSILFSLLSIILSNVRINKNFQIIISSAIILIYSSVSEFTPSVLRASIMLIIFMFSSVFDREYNSLTALFASALIILIKYPYALFTSGFLLSFSATFGIVIFYNLFVSFIKRYFHKASLLLPTGSICLSLSAFLGTLPFCILFFDKLSFWSLVTNIWILPVVFVIFYLGILSALFYYIFTPVSFFIRYLTEPFVCLLLKTAKIFSGLKFGIISFDYVSWCFYIYYVMFFFIFYYILKCEKTVRMRRQDY